MARAIILDFDGVLVDSEPAHETALRAALATHGLELTSRLYRDSLVGLDDIEIFHRIARAADRTLLPRDIAALEAAKEREFSRIVARGEIRAFPGSLPLIHAASLAHIPLAIASAARRTEIDAVLRSLELRAAFRAIVALEDVPISKPDPAPYVLAAERLGLAPAHCVAVEDTDTGLRSALAAGCRACAVCHTLPASRLAGAHRIAATIAEVTLADLLAL